MDLALTLETHHEPLRLFVNGALVAEVTVGITQDAVSLAAEVTRARVLERLAWTVQQWQAHLLTVQDMPDPVNKTPAARTEAFSQGLRDGLSERTFPHPSPGVPALPAGHTQSYRLGYEDGTMLARCLELLGEARA